MTLPNPIDELKPAPCPFCGAAMINDAANGAFHHPGVNGDGTCLVSGMGFWSKYIDLWNTRAPDPALSTLQERNRKLEEALKPFAEFAAAWDRKPLLGIGDGFYSIHGGTEFEGTVRLSDCRRARALLSGGGE